MELLEGVQQRSTKKIKGSDMWEEAEKFGIAHPGEMKAQRDVIHVYKYPAVGNEKEPDSAQWRQLTGKESMSKN